MHDQREDKDKDKGKDKESVLIETESMQLGILPCRGMLVVEDD